MTSLLTIDTSSPICTVSLWAEGAMSERISDAQRQSAQRLLPMIAELLAEANLSASDLDLIVVVAGPGSFTGVRIGVAAAQGLSMSANIPVVPVSSLALTALASLENSKSDGALVCEKAREGEVYFAAYRRSVERGVEVVGREQVAAISEIDVLPKEYQDENWCLSGNGWGQRDALLKQLGCRSASEPIVPAIINAFMERLGRLKFEQGDAVAAAELRPNYVKEQLDYT